MSNNQPMKDVLAFDFGASGPQWRQNWTKIATMPFARTFHASAVIGPVIYVCGGWIDGVNMR